MDVSYDYMNIDSQVRDLPGPSAANSTDLFICKEDKIYL